MKSLSDIALDSLEESRGEIEKPVDPRHVALEEAWMAVERKDQAGFVEAFNNAIEIAMAQRQ